MDDHVGGHGGVGRGRQLAAGVGDEARVDAQGLGEQPALLEEGGVDLEGEMRTRDAREAEDGL